MTEKKNNVSVLFLLFSVLFCVCLITANVLETKQISLGFINITGGLLVFPVSTSSTTACVRCGVIARRDSSSGWALP